MVNSFLCSSTNYLENRLLPNELIIVWNHEDDEEDKWDIKRVLERQGERTSRWNSNSIWNSRV
jgi:hypothetical protein